MAHDNCDNCQTDYEFDSGRDLMMQFIRDWQCNHIQAVCPQCGTISRIYVEPEVFIAIMAEHKLTIRMYPDAPDDIKAAHSGLVPPPAPSDTPTSELPPIPRDWNISLWDTMREFGGES